ncbi:hypothetical protein EJ04DRAFT_553858 [Polyplosphaeria fusca]|uniref:Uncharacterized protein n=1 Tax=Polyplosphaeria fusca TaxID=682080 RepID=A0A9P4QX84_9PLEO|nr:hypothetical protein EJ04DRAFT_553858 [Polyplosphaeria fusca]
MPHPTPRPRAETQTDPFPHFSLHREGVPAPASLPLSSPSPSPKPPPPSSSVNQGFFYTSPLTHTTHTLFPGTPRDLLEQRSPLFFKLPPSEGSLIIALGAYEDHEVEEQQDMPGCVHCSSSHTHTRTRPSSNPSTTAAAAATRNVDVVTVEHLWPYGASDERSKRVWRDAVARGGGGR